MLNEKPSWLILSKNASLEIIEPLFLLSICSEPLLFLYIVNPLCNQADPSG